MKKYTAQDQAEVSRGDLSPFQIILLDAILKGHGLPPTSPHEVPPLLTFVCLKCGTIAVSEDTASRDLYVENFDMTCCGLTVVFHSTHKVLVNADGMTLVRQES